MPRVVLQAVSFCYGPAAIAIAVAEALRRRARSEIEIIGMGTGSAAELLCSSSAFDGTVQTEPTRLTSLACNALGSSDVILSVCDFDFASEVSRRGYTAGFIDPLLWLWDELPAKQIGNCVPYYVLDFPGVGEYLGHLDTPSLRVIPQIAHAPYARGSTSPIATDSTVLVHFGGMMSPLGCNSELAQALIVDLHDTQTQYFPAMNLKVRCGRAAAEMIRSRMPRRLQTIDMKGLGHKKFQQELSTCDRLLTVPGMSIIFEAAAIECPTAFMLPLNYSQHRQQEAYRSMFPDAPSLSWNDLHGYGTLLAGLPEAIGVQRALQLGAQFAQDPVARRTFRAWARVALGNAIPRLSASAGRWQPSGADQIADDVLSTVTLDSGKAGSNDL